MAETITVKIGNWEETYIPAITSAPKAYDGFGTIELHVLSIDPDTKKEKRIILIPTSALDWQTGRNSSGMYYTDIDEMDKNMVKWIEQKMIENFKKGGSKS